MFRIGLVLGIGLFLFTMYCCFLVGGRDEHERRMDDMQQEEFIKELRKHGKK